MKVKEFLKSKKFRFVIVIITLFGVWWGADFYLLSIVFPRTPTWHGITPGRTTITQALSILGESIEIYKHGYYKVYHFEDLDDPMKFNGWAYIDLVTGIRKDQEKVLVIVRRAPFSQKNESNRYQSMADVNSLEILVVENKKPERVTWSSNCSTRSLIWASQGVLAEVSSHPHLFNWDELVVMSVINFKPMALDEFENLAVNKWPQFGATPSRVNPCWDRWLKDYIEDPYDWENMPNP